MRGYRMKKWTVWLCGLLRCFLFIGFSVRIVLGLAWLCLHFMEVQAFAPETKGVYPLLLQIFGGVPQVLYLFQLAAACISGFLFFKPYCGPGIGKRVWAVLAFLTFPMAMQCHLALLPYSFVSSLILSELSFCREAFAGKGKEAAATAKAGACWLGLSLLLPEYVWLGGIPLLLAVPAWIVRFRGNFRRLCGCILVAAAFGGMAAGLHSLEPGEALREPENVFWAAMAGRMAWPKLYEDHDKWSFELREAAEDVVLEAGSSPDNMERVFRPALEAALGQETATQYYREIAETAWRIHKGQIVKQIAWDLATYAAPSAVLPLQLSGRGYESYSGRNYEVMFLNHPRLTKRYVDYSCWWFFAAAGAALPAAFLQRAAGAKGKKVPGGRAPWRGSLFFMAAAAAWMGLLVCYYTMRGAGIGDYKCTVAVSCLWTAAAVRVMGRWE